MSDQPQSSDEHHDQHAMSIMDHLFEMRRRILNALLAMLLIFLCLTPFTNEIYGYVAQPILNVLPEGVSMIATNVTTPFFSPFKLALVLSLFLAMPMVLHQIWKFVSPGLYQNEKRIALPLLVSSIVLFYGGIAFAYYVIFPIIMSFFANIGPEHVQLTPDINEYLSIALKLFFAFGCAFQIPVATVLLIMSGIVDAKSLASKRAYVIVGCFFFGMLLTPPDIISQTLLAIPMWLLFEFGLILGKFVRPNTSSSSI